MITYLIKSNNNFINEDFFNDINQLLNESGVEISDITGCTDLAIKLIGISKQISSKFNGKVYYKSDNIKDKIENLDKTVNKIDEELEEIKSNNYKPKASTIAKYFISFTILYLGSSLCIGSTSAMISYSGSKFAVKGYNIGKNIAIKQMTKAVEVATVESALITKSISYGSVVAVLTPILSISTTVAFLHDYKKSLEKWKNNLLTLRNDLDYEYKKMKKIESQK